MRFGPIRERKRIEHFLRREARAHVYAIADLDDVFWGDTRWFAAFDGHDVEAICLLLDGLALPILYAVCPDGDAATRDLLLAFRPRLPTRWEPSPNTFQRGRNGSAPTGKVRSRLAPRPQRSSKQ